MRQTCANVSSRKWKGSSAIGATASLPLRCRSLRPGGPPSDRPTRDTASSRGRVRQGFTAGHHGCADGSNGHRRTTRLRGAPSVNSQVGYMTGDHPQQRADAGQPARRRQDPPGRVVARRQWQGTLSDAWRRAGIRRANGKSKRPQTQLFTKGAIDERKQVQALMGNFRSCSGHQMMRG